jgi:hypothetical protein
VRTREERQREGGYCTLPIVVAVASAFLGHREDVLWLHFFPKKVMQTLRICK